MSDVSRSSPAPLTPPVGQDDYSIRPLHWLVLLALVALAAALRLTRLDAASLSFDELMSLHLSAGFNFAVDRLPRGVVIDDLPDFLHISQARPWWTIPVSLSGDVHPPLYYLALHFWRDVFGDSAAAIRSLSAVFGTLVVVATAFAGRELAGTRAGLLAAAIVTVAGGAIYFSQDARMYAMAMLWLTLAAGTALRIERLGFNARRGAALGACFLAAMLTLYLSLSVCAVIGAYVIWRSRSSRKGAVFAIIIPAAIFVAAWMPMMLRQDWNSAKANWLRAQESKIDDHGASTLSRLVAAPLVEFSAGPSPDLGRECLYATLFLILPAVAAARRPQVLLPYVAALTAFAVPASRDFLSTTAMLRWERYTILALPFQAIALTAAGFALFRGSARALPGAVLGIYAVCSLFLPSQRLHFDFRNYAQFAEAELEKDPRRRVVVMTDGGPGFDGGLILAICYYWQRWPDRVVIVESPDAFEALPRSLIGDEIVMIAGQKMVPSQPFRSFVQAGPRTAYSGVGYTMAMTRIKAAATSEATR